MSNSSDTHLPKSDELIKFASDIVAALTAASPAPDGAVRGLRLVSRKTWTPTRPRAVGR